MKLAVKALVAKIDRQRRGVGAEELRDGGEIGGEGCGGDQTRKNSTRDWHDNEFDVQAFRE